jgi:vacuolar protein sorting-associated protein 29
MIVALGDTHIPGRAQKIPPALMKEIQKANPEKILFTGDAVVESVITELEKIAPVVKVRGNMDALGSSQKEEIVDWENFKILLFHGTGILPRGDHEQLESIAMARKCRILVTGHTHKPEVWMGNRAAILNPGSATGAWGGNGNEFPPSIMVLDSNQKMLRVSLISLENTDIKTKGWNLDLGILY